MNTYHSRVLILFVCNSLVDASVDWDTRVLEPNAFDLELYESSLDPVLCSEQLQYIAGNTLLRLKFLDAGLKIPRGIFDGNFDDLGNYYQCLAITNDGSSSVIHGKYCSITVTIQPGNMQSLKLLYPGLVTDIGDDTLKKVKQVQVQKHWIHNFDADFDSSRVSPDIPLGAISWNLAVCIPKTCTTREAIDSLLFNTTSLGLTYTENYCRLPNDKPFVAADYVAFAVFGLIGVLTTLSTIYDVRHSVILRNDPTTINKLYQSFSVYTNARRLTSHKSNPNTIECLDGIRVLNMVWVILLHTYSTQISYFLSNPLDIVEWRTYPYSTFITGGINSVDSFFFLSGILLVYTTAGKLKKRMSLIKNIHLFYLNRLLRLFPLLAAVILLMASWFNHVTDGPYWQPVARKVHNCRTFWWTTLLHVQNYVYTNRMCLGPTWYLAADVQLHIASPLVLFWVLTNKRSAWISLTAAFIACVIAATAFNAVNNFISSPFFPGTFEQELDFSQNYYINTLTRAPQFILGMIFGYLLYKNREKRFRINKNLVVTLWCLIVGLCALNFYVTYIIQQDEWDSDVGNVLVNSFLKIEWVLAVGLTVWVCAIGYGGPINYILSLKFWKIPSRLSYAMYLLHYPVMIMVTSSSLAPVVFNDSAFLYKYFANMAMTFFMAFAATLLIDSPASILIKIIMGPEAKNPKDSPPNK